mgnify:FL=1
MLSNDDEERKKNREKRIPTAERKDQVNKSHFQKNMSSTPKTRVKIRNFDGKNFALWKEMMQEMLVIRRQVEAM